MTGKVKLNRFLQKYEYHCLSNNEAVLLFICFILYLKQLAMTLRVSFVKKNQFAY